jgi:hypothetical protein
VGMVKVHEACSYKVALKLLIKGVFAFLCVTMFKYGLATLTAAIILIFNTASAQQTDSLKKDTVKIDTAVLNKFRIEPRKNAFPTRMRPLQLQAEQVPVTMLDYKVSYWRKWIAFGININQSGFSNNWSGGGTNNFAIGGTFDYKTEYNKAPFNYTSQLILIYGKSRNQGHIARKTNDRIFWDNKIATQLSKSWFFFGSVSFESQIDLGFQYFDNSNPLLISRFMSPGYVTESIGVEYKPNSVFDLRIGTGTARQTFVLDTSLYRNKAGNYGVPVGSTFKNELAFQVVALFDKDVMQNLHLTSRYAMFLPYAMFNKIDHRLDASLIAKVNRLINVSITATALYDNDTSNKIQGTEALALGVVYKFPY